MPHIALVPVIELGYQNQGVESPGVFPSWEHPSQWQAYYDRCYEAAGFPHRFVPFRSGLSLYRLSEIHDANLAKLVLDHLEGYLRGELVREQVCPLFGGFVLVVDGTAELYPQCCGDLSDLRFWDALAAGRDDASWEGHPWPDVIQAGDVVELRCTDEIEDFSPPAKPVIELPRAALHRACLEARQEIDLMAPKIAALGEDAGIRDLARLVLYGDQILYSGTESPNPEETVR